MLSLARITSRSSRAMMEGLGRFVMVAIALAAVVEAGFIDMDTPLDKRTTTSLVDGSVYHLVSYNCAKGVRCAVISPSAWRDNYPRDGSRRLFPVIRSCPMNSMSPTDPSRTAMILCGLLWTNPMTILLQQAEGPCNSTILQLWKLSMDPCLSTQPWGRQHG